jgi:hypothetical protein
MISSPWEPHHKEVDEEGYIRLMFGARCAQVETYRDTPRIAAGYRGVGGRVPTTEGGVDAVHAIALQPHQVAARVDNCDELLGRRAHRDLHHVFGVLIAMSCGALEPCQSLIRSGDVMRPCFRDLPRRCGTLKNVFVCRQWRVWVVSVNQVALKHLEYRYVKQNPSICMHQDINLYAKSSSIEYAQQGSIVTE